MEGKKKRYPVRKNGKLRKQVLEMEKAVRYQKDGPKLEGGKPVSLSKAERLNDLWVQRPEDIKD